MPKYSIDNSTGCWIWQKRITKAGYGRLPNEDVYAHRHMYEKHVGPIPKGLVIDHLCRNRACVNPEHLEPVTHTENVRRGVSAAVNRTRQLARTHCARGHKYTEENTKFTPRQRKCRECIRIDSRNAHARRRAEAA